MRIVFIRHGESTGNAGMPTADPATIELTPTGQAQAARTAASWERAPTLIACSPYLRTRQTARPTIDRFPRVPVRILPMEEFTYLDPVRWNGTARSERLPAIERYWQAADPAYRDGGGAESFDDLLGRVGQTLAQLQELLADARVYAFGHGQFMQAMRLSLLHPEWTSRQRMARFRAFDVRYPIHNVDRFDLRRTDGRWTTAAPAP
jgi:broad specificity phosphatase PhoE